MPQGPSRATPRTTNRRRPSNRSSPRSWSLSSRPPHLTGRATLPIAALRDEPCLLTKSGSVLRDTILAACAAAGFAPRIASSRAAPPPSALSPPRARRRHPPPLRGHPGRAAPHPARPQPRLTRTVGPRPRRRPPPIGGGRGVHGPRARIPPAARLTSHPYRAPPAAQSPPGIGPHTPAAAAIPTLPCRGGSPPRRRGEVRPALTARAILGPQAKTKL
jgi:hypothetical protein